MPPRTKAIILEQGRRLARREQWWTKKRIFNYVFFKGTTCGLLKLYYKAVVFKNSIKIKDYEGSSKNIFVRVLKQLEFFLFIFFFKSQACLWEQVHGENKMSTNFNISHIKLNLLF